jgi:formate dehydrogenase beta subunit
MRGVSRRELFGLAALGAAGTVAGSPATAAADGVQAPRDAVAMLYDTTRCTGCKACMPACAEANGLAPDTGMSGGIWQMPLDLNAQTKNVIKLWQSDDRTEWSFVKRQCMHCLDPACVSGCPFSALEKNAQDGVVAWNPSQCIGCRYCEVACPFEIPKFEWDRFNPKIVKCQFCDHRLAQGVQPACTAACPVGAVIFGTRDELLADAHGRIAAAPGKYFEDRVYGEHDAGGTQVLYLSHVPFADIGLPAVSTVSNPEQARKWPRRIYKWLWGPLALYGVLAAVIQRRWREHEREAERLERDTGLKEQL